MNDLTPTQNSPQNRPTTPELGKALSELLDSEGSPDAAARQIAWNPALIAEAKAALPALRQVAEAKAGEDGVRRVIAKRFETYPQPQRSDEGWAAWWADYFDVLADVSLASLEAGMRAYVKLPDSEFMPKPGKLRELAFSAPCRALTRLHRATIAVRMAEYEPPKMPPQGTVETASIEDLLADFKAKAIPPASQRPELPSIAGKVDEGGITPEMRELIARRQADA